MHSIYIHIPFCNNICSYCAFTKFYYNKNMVLKYLEALEKEIKSNYQGEELKTVYIGGGTPSSLDVEELQKLFEIIKMFNLDQNIEFTIEVNPESITEEKLALFKKNKVNRISLGIESTNDKYLQYLERNYNFDLVKKKVKLIKQYGFNNINVDLIYAIKNQTLKELENDIDNILSLDINHISTYSLMIEPHTKLYIKKETSIDEEIDYNMYKLICRKLKDNGFIHYEVSNFSKKGYESRHNLVYWNNEHYYGFGLSASGYIDNIRYTNTTSFRDYLRQNYLKEKEILQSKDILSYAFILGFRLIKGINKDKFFQKYNVKIDELEIIQKLIKSKDLIDNGMNIYINYDKIYVENTILINFIGE